MVNLAGTIYGTVIATALVAGMSEDDSLSEGEILLSLAATMVAFWIAHAYANLLAGHASGGRLPTWRQVRAGLAHEWSIVQAAMPAAGALLLGVIGMLSQTAAKDTAIGIGLVGLAGWGWILARRDRLSPGRALAVGLASAALGAVVIAVKLAVD